MPILNNSLLNKDIARKVFCQHTRNITCPLNFALVESYKIQTKKGEVHQNFHLSYGGYVFVCASS